MWVQTLLDELKVPHPSAAQLWCDNIGATYLSANSVSMLELSILKLIIICSRTSSSEIFDIKFIPAGDQVADGFTN
jgi:hypothetical protein